MKIQMCFWTWILYTEKAEFFAFTESFNISLQLIAFILCSPCVSWPLLNQIAFVCSPSNFIDRAIWSICFVSHLFLPVVWCRCSGADAIPHALPEQSHELSETPTFTVFPSGPAISGSNGLCYSDNEWEVSHSLLSNPNHTIQVFLTELEL